MLAEDFFSLPYSLEVCQIDFTTYLDLTSRSNLWMMARSWPPGQVVLQLVCTTIGFLDNLYWTQVELKSFRAFQVSQPTHKAWLRSLRLSVSANISIDCSCSGFGNLPNQCQTLLQEKKKQLHVPVLLCLINMTVSLLCLYITLWCESAS